ncbi:hypothetical protein QAD02_023337, partial [Eretmocerus hayati]
MGGKCCKCDKEKKHIWKSNRHSRHRHREEAPYPCERFRVEARGNKVQLTLQHASRDDAGHYALIAKRLPHDNESERLFSRRVHMSIDEPSFTEEGDPPLFLRRLTDLTVKVGTRTRFLVEIRSNTDPKVSWHRNDEAIQAGPRFSFVHEGNFFCVDVAPVTVEDQGHWTCMAENRSGRSSCTSHLNVIVPKAYKRPEFVSELCALLTETGTVSLECKVIGVPTPVLKWFKDDKEIKAGDVFALTANPNDPTSLGTYTCEAVNCMGTAYSSSRVHVAGRGSREGSLKPADKLITGDPPIFNKILRDESCKIGESLLLKCQVQVPPWPKDITWYNKEGRIENSDRYKTAEDGSGGYSIYVKPVEAVDEGEWKCVATSYENVKQFTTCYVAMSIPKNYRKPRFMESLKAVLTEEGLVSFECKVVGFPTPLLRWFKDGQELKPGDVYQLTGTNSLGSYCCIAKNCMGEAKSLAELTVEDIQNQLNEEERLQLLTTNQPPKFIRGLRSTEAKILENFKFTVQVSVMPEPNLAWFRDDQPISSEGKYYIDRESLGTCHLEVKRLEFFDQAEWKCVASNDFGQSITSCFLKLTIPKHYKKPKFLENLRAILSDEGAVNLECKVIGVPQPVLKWYKDGEELKPGDIHRIISGQDGTCCLGTYTCEATNCMGTESSSAALLGFEDRVSSPQVLSSNQPLINHIDDERELARNLSLSTIHEERTSQLLDTAQTDHSVTIDDRGEVSFSFEGKEISVSLYETPDLTEEEALQIVEMYADQLSEHVTEHNIVELPPMRFVKETSTSGNLLMEAVVIDVSPDYFVSAGDDEDLRTEADFEDMSMIDGNSLSSQLLTASNDSTKVPIRPSRRRSSSTLEKFQEQQELEFYHSAKEPTILIDKNADSERFDDALSSGHAQFEDVAMDIDKSKEQRKRIMSGGSSLENADSSIDSASGIAKKKLKGEKKLKKKRRLEEKGSSEESSAGTLNDEKEAILDEDILPPDDEDEGSRSSSKSNKERMVDVLRKILEPVLVIKEALTDSEIFHENENLIDMFVNDNIINPIQSLCELIADIETKALENTGDKSFLQSVRISILETIGGPTEELLRGLELMKRDGGGDYDMVNLSILESLVDPVDEILMGLAKLEFELSGRNICESPVVLDRTIRTISRFGETLKIMDDTTDPAMATALRNMHQILDDYLNSISLNQFGGWTENIDAVLVESLARPLEDLERSSQYVIGRKMSRELFDWEGSMSESVNEVLSRLDALVVALEGYESDYRTNFVINLKTSLVAATEVLPKSNRNKFETTFGADLSELILDPLIDAQTAFDTILHEVQKIAEEGEMTVFQTSELASSLADLRDAVSYAVHKTTTLRKEDAVTALINLKEPLIGLQSAVSLDHAPEELLIIQSISDPLNSLRRVIDRVIDSSRGTDESDGVVDLFDATLRILEDLESKVSSITSNRGHEGLYDESARNESFEFAEDFQEKIRTLQIPAELGEVHFELANIIDNSGHPKENVEIAPIFEIIGALRQDIGNAAIAIDQIVSTDGVLFADIVAQLSTLKKPLQELQIFLGTKESIPMEVSLISSLFAPLQRLESIVEKISVHNHPVEMVVEIIDLIRLSKKSLEVNILGVTKNAVEERLDIDPESYSSLEVQPDDVSDRATIKSVRASQDSQYFGGRESESQNSTGINDITESPVDLAYDIPLDTPGDFEVKTGKMSEKNAIHSREEFASMISHSLDQIQQEILEILDQFEQGSVTTPHPVSRLAGALENLRRTILVVRSNVSQIALEISDVNSESSIAESHESTERISLSLKRLLQPILEIREALAQTQDHGPSEVLLLSRLDQPIRAIEFNVLQLALEAHSHTVESDETSSRVSLDAMARALEEIETQIPIALDEVNLRRESLSILRDISNSLDIIKEKIQEISSDAVDESSMGLDIANVLDEPISDFRDVLQELFLVLGSNENSDDSQGRAVLLFKHLIEPLVELQSSLTVVRNSRRTSIAENGLFDRRKNVTLRGVEGVRFGIEQMRIEIESKGVVTAFERMIMSTVNDLDSALALAQNQLSKTCYVREDSYLESLKQRLAEPLQDLQVGITILKEQISETILQCMEEPLNILSQQISWAQAQFSQASDQHLDEEAIIEGFLYPIQRLLQSLESINFSTNIVDPSDNAKLRRFGECTSNFGTILAIFEENLTDESFDDKASMIETLHAVSVCFNGVMDKINESSIGSKDNPQALSTKSNEIEDSVIRSFPDEPSDPCILRHGKNEQRRDETMPMILTTVETIVDEFIEVSKRETESVTMLQVAGEELSIKENDVVDRIGASQTDQIQELGRASENIILPTTESSQLETQFVIESISKLLCDRQDSVKAFWSIIYEPLENLQESVISILQDSFENSISHGSEQEYSEDLIVLNRLEDLKSAIANMQEVVNDGSQMITPLSWQEKCLPALQNLAISLESLGEHLPMPHQSLTSVDGFVESEGVVESTSMARALKTLIVPLHELKECLSSIVEHHAKVPPDNIETREHSTRENEESRVTIGGILSCVEDRTKNFLREESTSMYMEGQVHTDELIVDLEGAEENHETKHIDSSGQGQIQEMGKYEIQGVNQDTNSQKNTVQLRQGGETEARDLLRKNSGVLQLLDEVGNEKTDEESLESERVRRKKEGGNETRDPGDREQTNVQRSQERKRDEGGEGGESGREMQTQVEGADMGGSGQFKQEAGSQKGERDEREGRNEEFKDRGSIPVAMECGDGEGKQIGDERKCEVEENESRWREILERKVQIQEGDRAGVEAEGEKFEMGRELGSEMEQTMEEHEVFGGEERHEVEKYDRSEREQLEDEYERRKPERAEQKGNEVKGEKQERVHVGIERKDTEGKRVEEGEERNEGVIARIEQGRGDEGVEREDGKPAKNEGAGAESKMGGVRLESSRDRIEHERSRAGEDYEGGETPPVGQEHSEQEPEHLEEERVRCVEEKEERKGEVPRLEQEREEEETERLEEEMERQQEEADRIEQERLEQEAKRVEEERFKREEEELKRKEEEARLERKRKEEECKRLEEQKKREQEEADRTEKERLEQEAKRQKEQQRERGEEECKRLEEQKKRQREEADRIEQERSEQEAKRQEEGRRLEEQKKRQQEEADRNEQKRLEQEAQRVEEERVKREEEKQKSKEEGARLEREREEKECKRLEEQRKRQQEETDCIEKERLEQEAKRQAKEQVEREEEEQKRKEEESRLQREREEEKCKRLEEQKKRQQEEADLQKKRQQEEADRIEQERLEQEAKRVEEERVKREEEKQKSKEEEARLEREREEEECKRLEEQRKRQQEETDRIEKERLEQEATRQAKEQVEREEEEQKRKEEESRLQREREEEECKRLGEQKKREQEEADRIEQERLEQEAKRVEEERVKREEEELKRKEEEARLQRERNEEECKRLEEQRKRQQEETDRIEKERLELEAKRQAKEQVEREEEEQKRKEEEARLQKEREEEECKRLEEQKKRQQEEADRIEQERLEQEAKRVEEKRVKREEEELKRKEEEARLQRERNEEECKRLEEQRKRQQEETDRIEKERLEQEAKRQAKEQVEREEEEQKRKEEESRLQREREEEECKRLEEQKKRQQEEADRIEQERLEQEAKRVEEKRVKREEEELKRKEEEARLERERNEEECKRLEEQKKREQEEADRTEKERLEQEAKPTDKKEVKCKGMEKEEKGSEEGTDRRQRHRLEEEISGHEDERVKLVEEGRKQQVEAEARSKMQREGQEFENNRDQSINKDVEHCQGEPIGLDQGSNNSRTKLPVSVQGSSLPQEMPTISHNETVLLILQQIASGQIHSNSFLRPEQVIISITKPLIELKKAIADVLDPHDSHATATGLETRKIKSPRIHQALTDLQTSIIIFEDVFDCKLEINQGESSSILQELIISLGKFGSLIATCNSDHQMSSPASSETGRDGMVDSLISLVEPLRQLRDSVGSLIDHDNSKNYTSLSIDSPVATDRNKQILAKSESSNIISTTHNGCDTSLSDSPSTEKENVEVVGSGNPQNDIQASPNLKYTRKASSQDQEQAHIKKLRETPAANRAKLSETYETPDNIQESKLKDVETSSSIRRHCTAVDEGMKYLNDHSDHKKVKSDSIQSDLRREKDSRVESATTHASQRSMLPKLEVDSTSYEQSKYISSRTSDDTSISKELWRSTIERPILSDAIKEANHFKSHRDLEYLPNTAIMRDKIQMHSRIDREYGSKSRDPFRPCTDVQPNHLHYSKGTSVPDLPSLNKSMGYLDYRNRYGASPLSSLNLELDSRKLVHDGSYTGYKRLSNLSPLSHKSFHSSDHSLSVSDTLSLNRSRRRFESRNAAAIYEGIPDVEHFTRNRRASRGKCPTFCTKLMNCTVAEGSHMRLMCTTLGHPEPQVYWTKNGDRIRYSGHEHAKYENGMATLEITSAELQDSGYYSCVAQNSHGQSSTEATVRVYSVYDSPTRKPNLDAYPTGKSKWSERELALGSLRSGRSISSNLLSKNEKNSTGFHYGRSLIEDSSRILRGSESDLSKFGYSSRKLTNKCDTDWVRHMVHFDDFSGAEIQRLRSRRRDYVLDDRTKYFGKDREKLPKISSTLTDHKVPAGGTIALQVEIKDTLTPKVTWLREKGEKTEPVSSKKVRTFAESGIYTLVLPEATESEAGTYVCRVSNDHGHVDTIANVEVIPLSKFDDLGKPAMFVSRPVDTMMSVMDGEAVSVSFRISGTPRPRVIWMKGVRDITDGPRSHKEILDDYVRLTLNRVNPEDEGTYCILVKNCYGCDRSFFTIKVRQRARSLTPTAERMSLSDRLSDIHLREQQSHRINVPGPIKSEPIVVDGGRNWLSLSWGKSDQRGPAPVIAYRVDAWQMGGDGGARWVELGISPINSFDAFNLRPGGEYKFRVTPRNRYGWGESVTMSKTATVCDDVEIPEFSKILPGQLKALVGSTVTLECEVRSESKFDVKWLRETTVIDPDENGRYIIKNERSKCTLILKSVDEDDTGRYVCEVTNKAGKVSSYARVLVVKDQKVLNADARLKKRFMDGLMEDGPPQFTMRLRDRRVQSSYPVRLTCQVFGVPEPEVTWYKDEKKVIENSTRSVYIDESHFHTLEIAVSNLDDAGCYKACAKNVNGSVSCSCILVVDKGIRAYIAPEFLYGLDVAYAVKMGGELRLSAQIEAYPSVGIVWHRDGIRLRPSRRAAMSLSHDGTVELFLAKITNRDAGVYTCTATNEVGRAETTARISVIGSDNGVSDATEDSSLHVVVNPPDVDLPYSRVPLFVTKPLSTEAQEGDTVVIQCEVVGDPKPEVMWLRDFLK